MASFHPRLAPPLSWAMTSGPAWQPSGPAGVSARNTTCALTCESPWAGGMAVGVLGAFWGLSCHGNFPPLSFVHGLRLTVDEHVWFYGRLKGLSAAAVGPEQDRLLQDMGLIPKRHAQTHHLSGEPRLGGASRSAGMRLGGGAGTLY